jgi:hypothetical protein
MPEDNNQVNDPNVVNVDKIVQNALGDKPFEIKQAFDNEMLDRVSQVIAGKKDAVHKGMFGDQELGAEPNDDEVLDQELTDDEIEDALNDEAPEEEAPEEPEQEEETPEEEPEVEPEEVENEEPNETT